MFIEQDLETCQSCIFLETVSTQQPQDGGKREPQELWSLPGQGTNHTFLAVVCHAVHTEKTCKNCGRPAAKLSIVH